MTVAISAEHSRAERVWFDASLGQLVVQSGEWVNAIPFEMIPDGDFESREPVMKFSIGHDGATVICHHRDGQETWLPSDMWLPGGFTPVPAATVA